MHVTIPDVSLDTFFHIVCVSRIIQTHPMRLISLSGGHQLTYMYFLQASTSDVLQCPLTVVGALQDRRYTADQVNVVTSCHV